MYSYELKRNHSRRKLFLKTLITSFQILQIPLPIIKIFNTIALFYKN